MRGVAVSFFCFCGVCDETLSADREEKSGVASPHFIKSSPEATPALLIAHYSLLTFLSDVSTSMSRQKLTASS